MSPVITCWHRGVRCAAVRMPDSQPVPNSSRRANVFSSASRSQRVIICSTAPTHRSSVSIDTYRAACGGSSGVPVERSNVRTIVPFRSSAATVLIAVSVSNSARENGWSNCTGGLTETSALLIPMIDRAETSWDDASCSRTAAPAECPTATSGRISSARSNAWTASRLQ